jgi:hypothetical protein
VLWCVQRGQHADVSVRCQRMTRTAVAQSWRGTGSRRACSAACDSATALSYILTAVAASGAFDVTRRVSCGALPGDLPWDLPGDR